MKPRYSASLFPLLLPVLLGGMFIAGCRTPEDQKESSMPATAIMDRPEILQVLFHPRKTVRTPLPPESTDIDVNIEDDVRIGCRLHGRDQDAPVILFFHGNGEIVADYDDIGPMYRQVGLNFLVTDYRGYGWSTGTPTSSSLLSDAHVLYRELKIWLADNGYSGDLFLMGRSLGSACAIELAAAFDDEISGLIIESGFAQTLPLARTLGMDLERLGVREEDTFNNAAKIAGVTSPTFILHGQRDTLIPIWQAEKLMAASPARTRELQIIPGADHNSLMAVGGIHYFQAIRQFIDKVTGRSEDWRQRRRRIKQQRQKG